MRAVCALVLCLMFLFLSLPAPGASMFENASEARLSNGLKVIMLENRLAPIVCFQLWYRAGADRETTGKTGLANLVEHMMFKGIGAMSGEKFLATVHELGGSASGGTSHDYAWYCETLPSSRIGVAIDFEANRMRNLKIDESDVRTEKMVALEERRMRIDDNPLAYLMEQLNAAAFQSEPYHWPVLGWTDDIGRLTSGDVRAFYSKYYGPANAFIVVTGDFKKEELLRKLQTAFGKIPEKAPANHYLLEDPPQRGERMVIVRRPARVGHLALAWHVPNLQSDDGYVLEVIKAVLSYGKSSRLYEGLVRQEGVALETSAHYELTSRNPGLFSIVASFLPEKDPGEVQRAIFDQLSLLGKTPVGTRELQKAKNLLEASFVFDHESMMSLGKKLAEYEIAYDWASISAYIPSIRSVTPQDVQRVAAKYFSAQTDTVGIMIPLASPVKTPARAIPGAGAGH
ncbi:MAG: pitrilysin family protein [Syntrophobacteraceae bacterium]|nr:pitrilysin family protein [Syntrophobacteraceae bacterium]